MKISPPIIIYRVSNLLYRFKFQIISELLSWFNRFLFATWIPGSAQIGKNIVIGYWGLGVVIHSKSVIGSNVWISQNVTIGRKEGTVGVPIIKDNVYIGPNSVVIGEITIGPNSVIGANSFVNKDVPPNAIVAGCPAKLIRFLKAGETYKKEFR